jgi:hypothetical protein
MDARDFERIAGRLPIGRDPASARRRLEAMEKILERSFMLPGLNRPVGLDAIIGLVPVIGDLIAAAMGSWMIWEGRNLGMSRWHLWRMAANIGVDTALGAVPIMGDIFDVAFRSNSRNLRIILRWLDKHHPQTIIVEGEVVARAEGES